jgi:hypothetical protein
LERDRYPGSLAIAQPAVPRPVLMLADADDTIAIAPTSPV